MISSAQFLRYRGLDTFAAVNKKFFFDPQTLCFAEMDGATWKLLSALKRIPEDRAASIQDLTKSVKGFPKNGEVEEIFSELDRFRSAVSTNATEQEQPRNRMEDVLTELTLNISHQCNLKCKYCFTADGCFEHDEDIMDVATGIRAIDFFLGHSSREKLSVHFFGGEPLCNFETLKAVVEHANAEALSLNKKIRYVLCTNGTLLSREILEFLGTHDFAIQVSLDGPRELHDAMRPFKNGKGSYDKIISNLRRLKDAGLARHLTLRCTYTFADGLLAERVKRLSQLVDSGHAGAFILEPAVVNPNSKLAFTPENVKRLKVQYEQVAAMYVDDLRSNRLMQFSNLNMIIRSLLTGNRVLSRCNAGRKRIVINPGGRIFACEQEGHSLIGDLETGVSDDLRRDWSCNRMEDKRECPTCWARFICGGPCRYASIEYFGDAAIPFETMCEFTRLFGKIAIWIISELDENERKRLSTNGSHFTNLS